MTIDHAVESDAGAILGILAETFPEEILTRTPLGCTGARQFIADTIRRRNQGCDVVWVVARDPAVVGFVEMRLAPRELFLNHIHVSPSRQNQGLGSRLLQGSIELTRPPAANRIGLSAFRDRERQIQWYSRLTFAEIQSSTWVTMSLECRSRLGWYGLGELLQADCMHARYGFSQVVLRTQRGTYRVGRLDDRFFRTDEAAILEDPAALGALADMGPGRQLVMTSIKDDRGITGKFRTTHSATALQMSAEIDDVLGRLSGGWSNRCAHS